MNNIQLNILPGEVVRAVCQHLLEDHEYPTYHGFSSLLVLARTSRVFHEHALDAIWHKLPGYGYLMFTMPQDAWTITMKEGTGSYHMKPSLSVSLTREVVESDLARIDRYARRVKSIVEKYESSHLPGYARRYVFDPTFLDCLAPYFSDRPLFPNLRVLHASPEYFRTASYYRSYPILFSPRLRNFYTNYENPRATGQEGFEHFVEMLKKLQETAPALSALLLNVVVEHFKPPPLPDAFSAALCSFQQLVAVHMMKTVVELKIVIHLAQLPHLRDVDLILDDDITLDDLRALPHKTRNNACFPVLRNLSVAHRTSLPHLSCFIEQVQSRQLRSISVRSTGWGVTVPLEDYTELFTCIGERKGKSRIRELRIVTCPQNGDTLVVDADVLTPLLGLKGLTHVRLDMHVRLALSDILIATMAVAWPNLTVLKLVPYGPEPKAESAGSDGQAPLTSMSEPPSLACLFYLAQACPHLCSLSLLLDTDMERVPVHHRRLRPGLGKVQEALTNLNVWRSRIDDPVRVAAFLSDLFPNLENIDCEWEFEEDEEELGEDEGEGEGDEREAERERIRKGAAFRVLWDNVQGTFLPHFVKVRKQEREWGRAKGWKMLPAVDFMHFVRQ